MVSVNPGLTPVPMLSIQCAFLMWTLTNAKIQNPFIFKILVTTLLLEIPD